MKVICDRLFIDWNLEWERAAEDLTWERVCIGSEFSSRALMIPFFLSGLC